MLPYLKPYVKRFSREEYFILGFGLVFYFHNKHEEHFLKRLKGSRDFYFNKIVRNCWSLKESSGNVGTTSSDISPSMDSPHFFWEQGARVGTCLCLISVPAHTSTYRHIYTFRYFS